MRLRVAAAECARPNSARRQCLLIYLRGHEGRGIGLGIKIKAYALQDVGVDTVEANERLGFEADLRDYSVAASILKFFSIDAVRILTNNPKKVAALKAAGIEITERVPLEVSVDTHAQAYLSAKKEKLGHLLKFGTPD